MAKIFKLALKINKANGQINTYVPRGQLPKSVLDALKDQPNSSRRLLAEFRGFEE